MASVVDQFNESLTLNDTSQEKGINESVAKSAFLKITFKTTKKVMHRKIEPKAKKQDKPKSGSQ